MTLSLGQLEEKYEVLHKIEEGGMGAVYKVRHRLFDQVWVVKVIRPQFADDEAAQRRFRYEAGTAIHLHHPNIARLHDFVYDEADGTSFMVMEYIDGLTLEEMIDQGGALDHRLVVEIARQALDALAYLHARMFIHRDVSPDNMMLTRSFDGTPRVKLIDLGIVKHIAATNGVTRTGMFVGKARYASPEAFAGGAHKPDERADLYSLGVVLYEALTGVCPIGGSGLQEIAAAHMFQPPLAFDKADPRGRVPTGVRRVVSKALEKAREDRFADAAVMQAALAPFAAAPAELARLLSERPELPAAAGGEAEPPRVAAGDSNASSGERERAAAAIESEPTPPGADDTQGAPAAAARAPDAAPPEQLVEAGVETPLSGGETGRHPESVTGRRPGGAEELEAREPADRQARIEQNLEAARWFIGRGAFTAAQWQLAEAETLDPNHSEVRRLRGRLVAGRRQRRIDTLLGAAQDHLERGELLRARYRLARLRRLDSELPELVELADELEAARHGRDVERERVRSARRRARNERRWARDERRQPVSERWRAAAAASRERALTRRLGRAEALLAAGRLEDAGVLLENLPSDPRKPES